MKVLVIQNRMGIGDLVIFLPYIFCISKTFNTPISLLVRENTKARDLLKNNPHISEIIILDRDDKNKFGRHHGISGTINLIKDLRKKKFDKSFTFNSSARYALITKLSGIKERFQYPLGEKKNQNIIEAAKEFIDKSLEKKVDPTSVLPIDEKAVNEVKKKYFSSSDTLYIALGVGGSGKTKRIPVEKFIQFMDLISEQKKCIFYLAAGSNDIEQKIVDKILATKHKNNCVSLNKMKIIETLPILKNCNLCVSNDTSFSHISAALGIKTITLLSDTPLLYGSYSSLMTPILPEGETNVTHDTLGKEKINPQEIFLKAKEILIH